MIAPPRSGAPSSVGRLAQRQPLCVRAENATLRADGRIRRTTLACEKAGSVARRVAVCLLQHIMLAGIPAGHNTHVWVGKGPQPGFPCPPADRVRSAATRRTTTLTRSWASSFSNRSRMCIRTVLIEVPVRAAIDSYVWAWQIRRAMSAWRTVRPKCTLSRAHCDSLNSLGRRSSPEADRRTIADRASVPTRRVPLDPLFRAPHDGVRPRSAIVRFSSAWACIRRVPTCEHPTPNSLGITARVSRYAPRFSCCGRGKHRNAAGSVAGCPAGAPQGAEIVEIDVAAGLIAFLDLKLIASLVVAAPAANGPLPRRQAASPRKPPRRLRRKCAPQRRQIGSALTAGRVRQPGTDCRIWDAPDAGCSICGGPITREKKCRKPARRTPPTKQASRSARDTRRRSASAPAASLG
jgi:hypothetical protein